MNKGGGIEKILRDNHEEVGEEWKEKGLAASKRCEKFVEDGAKSGKE